MSPSQDGPSRERPTITARSRCSQATLACNPAAFSQTHEHPARRLAGTGPKFQNTPGVIASSQDRFILKTLVVGHLRLHECQVRVRIPVELTHEQNLAGGAPTSCTARTRPIPGWSGRPPYRALPPCSGRRPGVSTRRHDQAQPRLDYRGHLRYLIAGWPPSARRSASRCGLVLGGVFCRAGGQDERHMDGR
jgi:hypothetical protein